MGKVTGTRVTETKMMGSAIRIHGIYAAVVLALLGVIWILFRNLARWRTAYRRERRGREEMESYTRMDVRLGRDTDLRALAERVCGVVSSRSPFKRVAMLARDADGRLYLSASMGMNAATTAAVEQWASRVVEAEQRGEEGPVDGVRLGAKSMAVRLSDCGDLAVVVPFSAVSGTMSGALVVCAASVLNVQRRAAEEAVVALEALGVKLSRALEDVELINRLLRAEKLAGLGLLAGGIAHSLNNPLMTVMGSAELIGETSGEKRTCHHAETILHEARKMQETVEGLLNFWRPSVLRDESVDIPALVQGLGEECRPKLAELGIKLTMQLGAETPAVRGNRDRLRLVMEHLLNNAVQAIAKARETSAAREEDAIRLTAGFDGRTVQIVVSDTGTGFREPGRVFDPFYTTQGPVQGSGLGLSICYGIVREHGGEVSAFNLHPAGAAIVIELPFAEVMTGQAVVIGEVA
ncbi:MAG: HAMP domain-containing histidine kinase [Acidobacteria bacterium]|nr:HAMP domain-containing histidine kinase [Acidobacteriota bacterium]